jgi:hypothetical protein
VPETHPIFTMSTRQGRQKQTESKTNSNLNPDKTSIQYPKKPARSNTYKKPESNPTL